LRIPIHASGCFYRKIPIGTCDVRIQPRLNDNQTEHGRIGQLPDGYEVTTELKLNLYLLGTQTQVSLDGKSEFDAKLELEGFDIATSVGEGRVTIAGNDITKRVKVVFSYDGIHDERSFDFDQIKGAGFASAFGMPGMGNVGFLGGGIPNLLAASPARGPSGGRPVTITYIDRLEIAGDSQPVYLIDTKVDEQMWTKMWVDDSGQLLKVTTSLGLEMISGGLTDGTDYQPRRSCTADIKWNDG